MTVLESATLRKIKLGLSYAYSPKTLETMREQSIEDAVSHKVTRSFTMTVYAQDLQEQTEVIRTPATWWDHLKADHSPRWFDHWFPPKFKTFTVTFKPIAMYPLANMETPALGKASYKVDVDVEEGE